MKPEPKPQPHPPQTPACSPGTCRCSSGLPRREFLRLTGWAATGAVVARWPSIAGPFAPEDFEKLVPADKKLSAAWVQSLFARGQPEVWRGTELAHLGMPIGGLCTGQLYLGGDGRLWYWDIFKSNYSSDYGGLSMGIHYANPPKPSFPIAQGFALRVAANGQPQVRELDARGFSQIAFRGEYPLARLAYRDPGCPVTVDLEAFSPFIPLAAEASAQPATIFEYTLKNLSAEPVEVELAGWLQNAVCPDNDTPALGSRRNTIRRLGGVLTLEGSAVPPPPRAQAEERPPILFDDFERETYDHWTTTGTAFGSGPVAQDRMPAYQGQVGAQGRRLVNSHAAAPGGDVAAKDSATGTLTSRPFVIERDFITFLVGGGRHPGKTCVHLLIDGQVAATATGHDANRLRLVFFDVSSFVGKTARLEIVDARSGSWGNIGVDHIVFTDQPPAGQQLEHLPGYGSMALSLLEATPADAATASVPDGFSPQAVFGALQPANAVETATRPLGRQIVGALCRNVALAPGQQAIVRFLFTWFFPTYPNPTGEFAAITDLPRLRRHYARRFSSATDVATSVAGGFAALAAQTRLWNQTWYDSTLPYWFLDRTFITLDTLATQTCHWFDNGRFYGWEGVDCCPGTCQHVWQYAQALARIFPQLERDVRERIDFGLAWRPNGAMGYRAESGRHVAHDGFAGTLLRVYREHQMCADDQFLRRLWPRVRQSLEYLMAEDRDGDGLLEGKQYNTLDAAWYGPMAWLSSLYLAALEAGRAMALAMGDEAFAGRCARRVAVGQKNLVAQLFNGEYFIHKPDPQHPEATNTNDGCHIDQVFGQSYAWQLGLGRVLPAAETRSALRSLWKYNFTPDIGPYRQEFAAIKSGRWYAMPGEGGLLMCTWPKGGAEKASGAGNPTFVGYFNECMTGFEYQVAAHCVWEGDPGSDLVQMGLAITRMIHDRYHAAKRNPYNEIECSDHYSRAMASYGVYLAACGYEYHGPRAHLGFAPRLTPEDFKAAFTAAEGWGTYRQRREGSTQSHLLDLKYGQLRLGTLAFALPPDATVRAATAMRGRNPVALAHAQRGSRVELTLNDAVTLRAGERLEVRLEVASA